MDWSQPARSFEEVMFGAEISACEACTRRGLKGFGRRPNAFFSWCRHCGRSRSFPFVLRDDAVMAGELTLGGPHPSQLLDALDFVGEITRLDQDIVSDPGQLPEPAWSASFEAITRLVMCLDELAKFERADLAEWIATERRRWSKVLTTYARDAARVYPRDPVTRPTAIPRGTLTREAIARHDQHVPDLSDEDPFGPRFDIAGCVADDIVLRDTSLRAFRLEEVRALRADLSGADWRDGALFHVAFERAVLHGTRFGVLEMTNARFDDASIVEHEHARRGVAGRS